MMQTLTATKKRPSKRALAKAIGVARRQVSGERALLAAVIGVAAVDLVQGNEQDRATAAAYFAGPVYQNHLQWLGLPGHWRPQLMDYYGRGNGNGRHK
jgi:hypothetical protein